MGRGKLQNTNYAATMQQRQDDRRLKRCSVRMPCPIEVCECPMKCVLLGDDPRQRPMRGRVKYRAAGCILSGIPDLCQAPPCVVIVEPDPTSFHLGCLHGTFDKTLPNLVELQ